MVEVRCDFTVFIWQFSSGGCRHSFVYRSECNALDVCYVLVIRYLHVTTFTLSVLMVIRVVVACINI